MIQIYDQRVFDQHRSGWSYAVGALAPLHSEDGVWFDGCLEDTFSWRRFRNEKDGVIPYVKPWVGFFHNPPEQPEWVTYSPLRTMVCDPLFVDSLPYCRGLFTLSESMAEKLREALEGVRVSSLPHPTDPEVPQWDVRRYQADKKVVHVGWWLRSMVWFKSVALPVRKVWLNPTHYQRQLESMEREAMLSVEGYNPVDRGDYETLDWLSNAEYDQLLTESVIVVNIIASAANNAVIEALVRSTPILINRIPAAEEYLGAEYPGYVDGPEVALKIKDVSFLYDLHCYLKERAKLVDFSAVMCRHRFQESEVMRRVDEPGSVITHHTKHLKRWHPKDLICSGFRNNG